MVARSGRDARRSSAVGDALVAAQERHAELMRIYRESQTQRRPSVADHDVAVLKRNYQFIRDEEADLERGERDWEVRMSVRYYRKLFREYALADLSRYKEGKVGLRWRTEMEVVAGKGQFICGNKRCDERRGLHSYELLFAYLEQGVKKRCLVKVRVCEECAKMLFYKKLKEREEETRRQERKKVKKESKRRRQVDSDGEEGGAPRKKHRSEGDRSAGKKNERQRSTPDIHAVCAQLNSADTQAFRDKQEEAQARESDREEIDTLLL